jgi:anti-sigma regulatory factor (Ser/Thr protein kinase)
MRFFQMDARKFTERLPGAPDQVRNARLVVAKVLGEAHPCIDEAVLLASETATNAVRHTDSGLLGGGFALTVEHTDVWARVTVRDDGSPRTPCLCPRGPTAESGRGVKMLDLLAFRWGLRREKRRNEVWFEVGQ